MPKKAEGGPRVAQWSHAVAGIRVGVIGRAPWPWVVEMQKDYIVARCATLGGAWMVAVALIIESEIRNGKSFIEAAGLIENLSRHLRDAFPKASNGAGL